MALKLKYLKILKDVEPPFVVDDDGNDTDVRHQGRSYQDGTRWPILHPLDHEDESDHLKYGPETELADCVDLARAEAMIATGAAEISIFASKTAEKKAAAKKRRPAGTKGAS